jgi:hypothetical protein
LELEQYVQRKVAELDPSESQRASFEFIIIDSLGVETLKNIKSFHRSYFPDDTKRLTIRYKPSDNPKLNIELNFTPNKESTNLEVFYDGTSAREITIGIASEIGEILSSYKTPNHWLYYGQGVPFILGLSGTFSLVILALRSKVSLVPVIFLWFILIFPIRGIVSILAAYFKPYSTFETRRNERRKKQENWLLLGIMAFILFTVIGVYLRQKLLGF